MQQHRDRVLDETQHIFQDHNLFEVTFTNYCDTEYMMAIQYSQLSSFSQASCLQMTHRKANNLW